MNKNINNFEKIFQEKTDKLKKMLEANNKIFEKHCHEIEDKKEAALAEELISQSNNMINQCLDGHKRILDIFSNKN